MKKVTLIVRQTEINKIFPNGLQLVLEENASALDAIKAGNEEIKRKCGNFPVKGFKSLLQWFIILMKIDFTSKLQSKRP
jgi:hypothetical protein